MLLDLGLQLPIGLTMKVDVVAFRTLHAETVSSSNSTRHSSARKRRLAYRRWRYSFLPPDHHKCCPHL
jgi:hypothetical protein